MDSFLDDNKLYFFICFDKEGDINIMKYMMYYEMEEAEEEQLLFDMFVEDECFDAVEKCTNLQSKEVDISKGKKGGS
eukprot:14489584-Ditylum_brightwellii.AAC.1